MKEKIEFVKQRTNFILKQMDKNTLSMLICLFVLEILVHISVFFFNRVSTNIS